MQTYQFVLLLVSIVILSGISRRSLKHPQHHGFFRFIAWEIIIIQVIWHLPVWFLDPLRWNQLCSWSLFIASILLVTAGFYYLRAYGGMGARKEISPNYEIEKTAYLVTRGIYRHIRHPIYCSMLVFVVGVFFKSLSFMGAILAFIAWGFIYLTAKVEEKENIKVFGKDYQAYMKTSSMFIPGLI